MNNRCLLVAMQVRCNFLAIFLSTIPYFFDSIAISLIILYKKKEIKRNKPALNSYLYSSVPSVSTLLNFLETK